MPYTRVTANDVERRLQATWDEVPFWTPPEARIAFNEALRTFNLLTGRWKRRITLPTGPGQYAVSLPSAITFRTRVSWDGFPLSPSSLPDLDLGRYRWREEDTASGGDVPGRPVIWVPVSLRLIYLWPADAVGGHGLTVDGICETPVFVSEADYLDLGDEALDALLGYALHAAAFAKGGVFFQATLPHFQRFLAYAAEENRAIKTSQAYRRFLGLPHQDQQPFHSTPAQPVGGTR